jgi:2-polyprenyl-6-methoxyphenol hydroxylase-like FAD-dependent oxidoreductase
MTHHLQRLLVADWKTPPDPTQAEFRISRPKLRQVLLTGLDDTVHFGRKFVRYEQTTDNHVMAFFDDGSSAVGDVLVGADGVSSNVRKQLLPRHSVRDLCIQAIAAKFRLTDDTARRLPRLHAGPMTIVLPARDSGMFVTPRCPPPVPARGLRHSGHGESRLLGTHRPARDVRPSRRPQAAVASGTPGRCAAHRARLGP